MIKSIKAILAQDKEKFKVPRKVQDLIPIKNIWPDGIFKVGNKFSKSFRFSDINYLVASREDKESMFLTYPVMQTPNKPDFYLKRSFDKSYSDYGVPYIDEACMTGISNNLVIYGHHMNDGSMFADLCKYTDADFCKEHPKIAFDTLSNLGKYEVVAAFKFNTNRETFKYNEYTLMDEVQFAEFMENIHARQLYDTGVTAEYGDQLLTLSTCEYTYPNGRFVVVAKKV